MSDSPLIPGSHSAPIDARTGMWRGEWYRFLRDLAAQPQITEDQSAAILALADRIAVLEAGGADLGNIIGLGSVLITGVLGEQVVVQLQGDDAAPGASYYYGTDASGTKGFWPVLANPMDTLGDIITGDVDGVPKRLGIGAADQVLGVVAGEPAYVDRVIEVQAGTDVTIDNTDPMRPIINVAASGGGEGGIGVSIGTYAATATVLVAGTEATSLADGGYDLTGDWYMWCYPPGSIEIDIWHDVFGAIPTVADSICGGTEPAIVAGTFASGTFAGPISIARTDTLLAHINSSTSVKWVKLLLIGDKT